MQLNTTSLFFLNTSNNEPEIVQVTLNSHVKIDVPTLITFHLYHQQISSLISAVVSEHRASDGDGLKVPAILSSVEYALVANNAPWPYGKKWKFRWGNEPVKSSPIKWVFTFVAVPTQV